MVLTMTQKFAQARAAYKHTAQKVADDLEISRAYVYEVLRFPSKNKRIYSYLCTYIRGAGIPVRKIKGY